MAVQAVMSRSVNPVLGKVIGLKMVKINFLYERLCIFLI